MIRTFRTATDERDLSALTHGRGSLGRNLLFVSLPIALVLSGVAYAIGRSLPVAALLGTVVFAASAWSNVRFFNSVRRRQAAQSNGDAVQVTEVEASRVVDIEPLGSHGPAFVFFSDDGKALLLIGQWLLEQKKFPSRSFRLSQWADSGQPIRIESTGRRIKPEHSTVRLNASYTIRDVELFDARPETLQADLDRANHAAR